MFGESSERVRSFLYSDGFIGRALILSYVGNYVVGAITGWSFGSLSPTQQTAVLATLAGFIFVTKVWGGERVVNEIWSPRWTALLSLDSRETGRFDVLVGPETSVESAEVIGDEELPTKKSYAGPEAYIAKEWREEDGENTFVAPWRGLYDPLEVEKDMAKIEANHRLITTELSDARELKRRILEYKHRVKEVQAGYIQQDWDAAMSEDGEASLESIEADLMDYYNEADDRIEGIQEDDDEDDEAEESDDSDGAEESKTQVKE